MNKNSVQIIKLAQEVLNIESEEILKASKNISINFSDAVNEIHQCCGRIVVSGMGKSGHIARKIASTFASTGTPAFFMHPGEASHGDLGMITQDDIVIFFSNSGQSNELISIFPTIKRIGAKIIGISGNVNSELANQADIHISAAVTKEACPLGLAPTASSSVSLALGDALALCVLDLREFTAEDFARSHPGGNLGKNILIKVKDIMRIGENIPSVNIKSSLKDAIEEISKKKVGFTGIVNNENTLIGILTDGDLRRALLSKKNIDSSIKECMTESPITLNGSEMAIEAVNIMEKFKVNCFLITDNNKKVIGMLNINDLFESKVI
ncbi:KpsF/GutQ family sugar-phosphate isomerase [Methylophilaceae bacterium]|jgi:arabinose-5-phosphate isomerase|nr:KpsF/GutQ family sugar-phosphate isomerase [Methylophilaceae bacterium]|tara:strand:- start:16318 stop:17292 length:975 start_codon:yes stop_codon:yes gene_type:complete